MTREQMIDLIRDGGDEFELRKGGDRMTARVLEGGRFRVDVEGSVSMANHGNADQFVGEAARFVGGSTDIRKKGHAHGREGHTHTHTHQH